MELQDYLNVIRTRKWVIVRVTLLVAMVALAVSFLQSPTYAGEAKLLLNEQNARAAIFGQSIPEYSDQAERSMETQVELAQITMIAEKVIKSEGLDETPEELLERVKFLPMGQSNVVIVEVEDGDAQQAADIANAFAYEYVEWTRVTKQRVLNEALDIVVKRMKATPEEPILAVDVDRTEREFLTLMEEQLGIYELLELGSASVVQTATPPADPVSPKPVLNTVLGLIVGLVFGLGMAFVAEFSDKTIKSMDEAAEIYGAPVLGQIPFDDSEKGGKAWQRRRKD